MTHLIIWFTWAFWLPTVLLGKAARGESGGTSIFPILPMFPIVGSLAAWGLNLATSRLGDYLIGGLHLVILSAMIVSSGVYGFQVRRRKKATE